MSVGNTLKSRRAKNEKKIRLKYDKNTVITSYAMLSVEIIGFFVITLFPLLWAIRLSWFSYDGIPSNTRFVGWTNFINIFTNDVTYWKTFLTTLQFAAIKIPFEISLALLIATLLSKKLKGTGFFRTMYFMPSIISVAICGLVFTNMFSYFGVMNRFLEYIGAISQNVDWFSAKWTALLVIVLADTWRTIGTNILYFISAISNVSDDLYEAAALDGANAWQKFIHVTVPGIAPIFQIILMMSLIGTIHTSDIVLVTTGGGPSGQTFTVMPYLTGTYAPGFADSGVNIGYGCALAVVTAIIMMIITLIYNKASSKMNNMY